MKTVKNFDINKLTLGSFTDSINRSDDFSHLRRFLKNLATVFFPSVGCPRRPRRWNDEKIPTLMSVPSLSASPSPKPASGQWRKGPLRLILTALLPLGIVFAVSAFLTRGSWKGLPAGLDPDKTYSLWIREVEIEAMRPDGSAWDLGNGAPDLQAILAIDGVVVLRTPVREDSIVAAWDPVSIRVSTILKGEIDRSEALRIANFRPREGQRFTFGVYEKDLLGSEFIDAVAFGDSVLGPGKNDLTGASPVRRASLIVQESGEEGAVGTDGPGKSMAVEWLGAEPAELKSPTTVLEERSARLFGEISEDMANEFRKLEGEARTRAEQVFEKLGEEVESSLIDLDSAAKELEARLREITAPVREDAR